MRRSNNWATTKRRGTDNWKLWGCSTIIDLFVNLRLAGRSSKHHNIDDVLFIYIMHKTYKWYRDTTSIYHCCLFRYGPSISTVCRRAAVSCTQSEGLAQLWSSFKQPVAVTTATSCVTSTDLMHCSSARGDHTSHLTRRLLYFLQQHTPILLLFYF